MALTTYIILERVKANVVPENGHQAVELEPVKGTPSEEDFVEVEAPEAVDVYRKIGALNAHSTDQALRKAAEQNGGGSLVAVSERHWKEERFEVETVTRVKVTSA